MKRAILSVFFVGTAGLLLAIPACHDQGVGDPCTPEQEYEPSFVGFDEKEVNVESKSFQCRTRVCLVNHFRGRASCPYGQSIDGTAPAGAKGACTVPGDATKPITGLKDPNDPNSFLDPSKKKLVRAGCADRKADLTVYCSCRCADINGATPSDQTFCKCPDGYACSPLVTSIGKGNEGLTGSYCIKSGTDYNKETACNKTVPALCEPLAKNCDP